MPDVKQLRFITAGSVDDGKSTLIGRLLYDSKSIFEDQLSAIETTTRRRGADRVDLSLLTDGLLAEREQGITIDVAYRYFSTPRRKFIVADTPGHEQYTRNMVTGASTANLAIILIDARHGVLVQSRRHAYLTGLIGIPHLIVAINKMDLVGYSEDVFDAIREEFDRFVVGLKFRTIDYIPISALQGDMVVDRGENLGWYHGSPCWSDWRQLKSTTISIGRISASRYNWSAALKRPIYPIFAVTWDASNRGKLRLAMKSKCFRPGAPRKSKRLLPSTAISSGHSRRSR